MLEHRAAELSASTTAKTRTELWKEDGNKALRPWPKCLVFVRGMFEKADATTVPEDFTRVDASFWDATKTDNLNKLLQNAGAGFKLQGVPEFYLELPLTYPSIIVPPQGLQDAKGPVADKLVNPITVPVAIELGPPVVRYFKPGPKRSRTTKRLIFTLTISTDAINNGKRESLVLVDFPIDLGEMSWPAKAGKEQFVSTTPIRMNLPYPFEERITLLFDTRKVLYASALNHVIVSSTGVLTESEDGSDIERAIAKVARENHKNFSDPVVKFLNDLIKKASEKQDNTQ